MDIICGVLYSFDHFRSVGRAFSNISGAIELATQLWLAGDACIAPSSTGIPLTTVALCFALTPRDFKTPHHQFEANDLPNGLSASIEDSDAARLCLQVLTALYRQLMERFLGSSTLPSLVFVLLLLGQSMLMSLGLPSWLISLPISAFSRPSIASRISRTRENTLHYKTCDHHY